MTVVTIVLCILSAVPSLRAAGQPDSGAQFRAAEHWSDSISRQWPERAAMDGWYYAAIKPELEQAEWFVAHEDDLYRSFYPDRDSATLTAHGGIRVAMPQFRDMLLADLAREDTLLGKYFYRMDIAEGVPNPKIEYWGVQDPRYEHHDLIARLDAAVEKFQARRKR